MKHCAVVILLSSALLAGAPEVHAQAKFDKAIKAVNEQYELGNYEESEKLLEKFKPKVDRKLGKQNRYSISILLAKARNALGQGMTSDFENFLQEAVKLSLATNPNASEDHAAVLIESAELFRRQGNILVALRALDQAKETLRNKPADVGGLRGRLQLTLGECLTEQGFYREAFSVLANERAYFENRAARQETYTDNRGQTKTRKLDESEVIVRFTEYARWLTAIANVSRKNGDLTKADTAFQHAGTWISRNLGKFSTEYVRNQIDYSSLFMENGLSPTEDFPMHAGLEQAYNNIREQHKPTHYLAMEALEQYIKRVIDQGNVGKFASLLSDYERLITDYFPKNSLYNVNRKLFDLNLREVKSTTGNLASEAAIMLASSPNLPRNHALSKKLNQFLFDFSVNQKNYRGAEPYILRVIDIQSALIGKQAPETHLDRLKLANFQVDYTNKLKEALAIYQSSYDSVVAPQIGYYQKDHLNILTHLASIYELTDQYQKATEILERAGRVARNKYSTEDPLYATVLIKSANLRINLGQYQTADDELVIANRILSPLRKDPAWKVDWVNLLETQARLAGVKGSYPEAEEFLDRAQTVIKKAADENLRFDDQGAARNLTTLNIQLGRYAQAEEMLEKTIAEYERVFGPGSVRLIEPLVNKGMLQLARGEYPDAEKTATRAYNIAISVYGENSTKSAITQKLLAELNFQLGDYEQAEDNFQKTIRSQQAQFGKEHLEVAKSLSRLGMVRYTKGDDPAKIQPVLQEARKIISEQLGTDNPPYADVLKDLAVISLSRKKFSEALSLLTEAEMIWTRKTGSKNSINAASIFALTGDVYYYQKNYLRAESFYNRGKDIYELSFSKNHPEYVEILSKLSRVYYMTKDYKKSKRFVEEAFINYENYIKRFFPALTEREKARYWNTIRTDFEFYNTLAFSQLDDFKDLSGNVYNNQLLTKALLLSSSIKIRERIKNSGNVELIKTYNLWTKKNEILTQALSMSSAQLAENEIDTRVLTEEVEQLEREISQQSEIFGQSFENKRVTYENIQKSLAKNEIALEIVRYRHFDHIFTDSVVYVGLYVRSDNARPKVINFPYGNQLETHFFRGYRNSVQYRVQDRFSYDAFWAPVEKQIGSNYSTIYLSADGVFNQVNLETLPLPDLSGQYIIDKFNIVYVNNTKDLYLRKSAQKSPQKSNTASLVGNPAFYSPKVKNRSFTDLPGTAMEVNEVRQLLSSKGWNASMLTETSATEEQVKSVDNPKIFHIATHGFYSPAVEKNIDSEMTETESQLSENPLMKSGLLLKGGGDILSLMPFNYNAENGVLTAYEAMSLNLDQTDLVVLSACETGAGEISNGEGVYGLQRAFLVAGAKMLIMSLFKVDDDATQSLIRNFYERWLQTGNMRLSLINAKKDVRKEHPDPLYWGSFMMIGLE